MKQQQLIVTVDVDDSADRTYGLMLAENLRLLLQIHALPSAGETTVELLEWPAIPKLINFPEAK